MSKSTWEYFLEQKQHLEQQQFKENLLMEVQFTLKEFQEQLRQEMDQKIRQVVQQQYQEQKAEIKIDASEAAKEIQRAFRLN